MYVTVTISNNTKLTGITRSAVVVFQRLKKMASSSSTKKGKSPAAVEKDFQKMNIRGKM